MSVPIPKTVVDVYYRYKRDLIILEEHKQYFLWTNFIIIMKQLHADANHFKKKFRRAMNQAIKCKDDILRFKSVPFELEDFLEAYIVKYILCGNCGLPELECGACRACGE